MWGIAPELTHPATPNAHHLWIEIAMKKAPAYPCLRLKPLNQHSLIPSFSNDREQAAERPALRYGFGEAGHER
jgi:desulfoferrodoxin (superoxide reductase-like protein)